MSKVAPVTAVFVMRCTASAAMSAGPTTRRIGSVVRSCSRRPSSWSPRIVAESGVGGGGGVVENPPERIEVCGIEGGCAGAKFEADAVQAMGASGGEDHLGSLATSKPGRFESDARATADHDDGLSGEFRLAAH